MASRAPGTASEHGWWSATGWERCAVCGERFDYEVEVRCADCDAAVCPLCAVEVTVHRTRACVRCAAGEEA